MFNFVYLFTYYVCKRLQNKFSKKSYANFVYFKRNHQTINKVNNIKRRSHFNLQKKFQIMTQSTASKPQFLILPSQRLLKYSPSTNNFSLLLKTRAQDFAQTKNSLALIFGKSVKHFNIKNDFTSSTPSTLQSYFPKKVEGITIDTQDKIIVTDKFGDIYEVRSQNSFYLNSNLGIPTFVKHIQNKSNNKEFIILGDDYCKIKVYNYKNMHQVTAIWYIANSVPLDVLQISQETAVLLVKYQDKQNLKHTYKLYQFRINDLEQGDFKGSLVYSDITVTLSNSDYHPCSITYCDQTKTLLFLKLYDEQIEVVSFSLDEKAKGLGLSKQIRIKLSHPVKEGNSIEGFVINQQKECYLLVSYGKYYNIDTETNTDEERNVEWSQFKKTDQAGIEVYEVSGNYQYLLKINLNYK